MNKIDKKALDIIKVYSPCNNYFALYKNCQYGIKMNYHEHKFIERVNLSIIYNKKNIQAKLYHKYGILLDVYNKDILLNLTSVDAHNNIIAIKNVEYLYDNINKIDYDHNKYEDILLNTTYIDMYEKYHDIDKFLECKDIDMCHIVRIAGFPITEQMILIEKNKLMPNFDIIKNRMKFHMTY